MLFREDRSKLIVCIHYRSLQVYGFVTVANETMARPIRTLTEARGYATARHMYVLLYRSVSSCHL
jgi:hypothetical protein